MTIVTLMTHTVEAAENGRPDRPGKATHGARKKARGAKQARRKESIALQNPDNSNELKRGNETTEPDETESKAEKSLRTPISFGNESAVLQMKLQRVLGKSPNLPDPGLSGGGSNSARGRGGGGGIHGDSIGFIPKQ